MRNKIKDILIEYSKRKESGDSYDYGCVMLYYDVPGWGKLIDMIDNDDLYIEDDNDQFGLEESPHVTLLYGLHSDEIDDEELFSHILWDKQPEFNMSNITLFNSSKYDVVKFDVEGDSLFSMNKSIADKFPFTSDYDYHPHSTIAYVKPGMGEKYIKKLSKPFVLKPNKLVYSKPDGSKITKKLNVK